MNNAAHTCDISTGYCNNCKTLVCDKCTYKEHFTHVESINHKSVDIAEHINHLCKTKFEIDKALHLHEVLVKTKVEEQVKELKHNFKNDSTAFNAFVFKHKEETIERIKSSRIVVKLRKLYNESKTQYEQMRALRAENKKKIMKLLSGIKDGKYNSDLVLVSDKDKLQKEMQKVEELKLFIGKTKMYESTLKKFSLLEVAFTNKTDKLKEVYRLNKQSLNGEGIAFIQNNTPKIAICYPLNSTYINFKSPSKGVLNDARNYSTIEIDNFLYIIGGDRDGLFGLKLFLNSVYKVNLDDGSITSLKPFAKPRRRVAIASIGKNEIYIMGGDTFEEKSAFAVEFFDTCEKLNVAYNKWSTYPKINRARTNIGAGTSNNRYIYLFGGYNNLDNDMNLIERLDTMNPENWVSINLSNDKNWSPIQSPAVKQITSEELLVFGGMRNGNSVDQCLIFKANNLSFEKAECMKEADSFLQSHPKVIFDVVYAFGCHKENLHAFDIKKRTWDLIKYKEQYKQLT